MVRSQVAVEPAGEVGIDARRWHVVAFLIRAGEHAVRPHAEADRMADAGGKDFELRAVLTCAVSSRRSECRCRQF